MSIKIACITPDQRELLDLISEEYCKFKDVVELPENVYQAFYWLCRYSDLITRKSQELVEEKQNVNQQTHGAIALWLSFLDSYRQGRGMNDWFSRNKERVNAVLAQQHHA